MINFFSFLTVGKQTKVMKNSCIRESLSIENGQSVKIYLLEVSLDGTVLKLVDTSKIAILLLP